MMAWTDRHCRYLHRLCSPTAFLFTEMVTAATVLNADDPRWARYHESEHPVAIQLGGSDPGALAEATEQAARAGYAEVNLNVGCPSPRVRRGCFGAALMLQPELVARCAAAMRNVTPRPVTVKCRLGVDGQDTQPLLERFIATVADAGVSTFYVHARKAVLDGLNPAQNRTIPPLQWNRVHQLKERFPDVDFILNGGIDSVSTARQQLALVDGVMIGRAAYHNPLLLTALHDVLGDNGSRAAVADNAYLAPIFQAYLNYAREQAREGVRVSALAKPMLGLVSGQPGARQFRRHLSPPSLGAYDSVDILAAAADQFLDTTRQAA